MPELTPSSPHPASLTQQLLAPQCTVHRTRSTGPGGQHRNKTDSAVTLIHQPTDLSVTATERRSQHENLRVAYRRLRLKLAVEHRISVDPSQPPSNLWGARVRNGRIVISPDHEDFPTLLAEALDRLAVCQYDPTWAAKVLEVSTSQFIKLLRKYPPALSRVNDHRRILGLHPLK